MWDYINIPDGFVICGIYKITSPNGKIYIGQSVDIRRRWKRYNSKDGSSQVKLYRSIVKYGIGNHIFEVIEECERLELNRRERYWQDYYNVIGENGLNLSLIDSEEEVRVMSQETKDKMSASRMGLKRPKSEEHRLKLRLALLGKSSMTEEGKKRVAEFMRKARTGIKVTDETKDKLKQSWKKRENTTANAKIVLCTETGIFYNSAKEAAMIYGIKPKTLNAYLSGALKNKTNLIYA